MGSIPRDNTDRSCLDAGNLSPLAVVGMSFRFPQDAVDASSFWKMLLEKRCASTQAPLSRFNINAHYHPDRDRLESSSVRGGHFLTGDLGAWDAPFFNITAAEAEAMDPSQRLTLEAAFRALENAGMPIDVVAGTKTSVYSATFMRDYDTLQNTDPDVQGKYRGTGSAPNMLSNRVSWFFDMRGPSGSIDTACSSSLLALDLVCQSIWSGDATMGLACGSNLMLTPHTTISLDNLGLLGKDGRCYSFDHRANGYARGEGVGVVVVKPLRAALRDGDTIRAVIRSSCSNQDGKTPAISQPSREAQEKLILDAYAKAGLDLGVTRYFEAHGTGTPVGDPIEAGSIGAAFRRYRSPDDPLYVGSVKSNIGHLEGAAGLAGVFKAILALEAGVIPPQANFEKLNSAIDTEFLNIKIPDEAVPWPSQGLRRASVQSFGIGGANSHVILDDARNFLGQHGLVGNHNTVAATPTRPRDLGEVFSGSRPGSEPYTNGTGSHHDTSEGLDADRRLQAQLLVWSAADEGGIERIRDAWRTYLANLNLHPRETSRYVSDLAYTLAARRTHFSYRAFSVVDSSHLQEAADQMSLSMRLSATPKLGFVFSGQGSQWYAMGRELFYRFPVYRSILVDASDYLRGLGCAWDVVEELMREEADTNVNHAEFSQPLCTIVQVALVDLLDSFGIRPAKVVGHSSGEIAAAYCAGALSKQAAWKISYLRGSLASQLTSATAGKPSKMQGAMMAVGLPESDAREHLRQVAEDLGSERLVIACVNSPQNVTISGEESHIDRLKAMLDTKPGVFQRKLKVKLAYHSFQMLEIAEEYLACLEPLGSPPVPALQRHGPVPLMASSVTGTWIQRDELAKPEYWVRNLVSPVLFSDALATMCASSETASWKLPTSKLDGSHAKAMPISELVEVGPHSVMQGPVRETLGAVHYVPALVRNRCSVATVLELAGRLHCFGHKIQIDQVNNISRTVSRRAEPFKVLTTLPQYPFNHSRSYWAESRLSKAFRFREFNRHDLLGARAIDWNPLDARWRHFVRTQELPWVKHHKINGVTLYPAAGMLVMAIEAARQLADPALELEAFNFRNVAFQSALTIPDGSDGVEVNLHVRPRKEAGGRDRGWLDFRLYRHGNSSISDWSQNCQGSIQLIYADPDRNDDEMGKAHENRAREQSLLSRVGEVKASCVHVTDPANLYKQLTASGYNYGPAFRGMSHMVWDGSEASISTVETYRWSRHFEGPDPGTAHIVHPTTLDVILHTMPAISTHGGTQKMPTLIPSFVERMWISAKGGLSSANADTVTVATVVTKRGSRGSRGTLIATDPESKAVLVEVDNFHSTAVTSNDDRDVDGLSVKPAYTVDWKPDPTFLTDAQLQAFCDHSVATESISHACHQRLDEFIIATISRTLHAIDTQGLDSSKYKNYVEWMRQLLAESQSELMNDDEYERLADELGDGSKRDRLISTIARHHLSLDGAKIRQVLSAQRLDEDYHSEIIQVPVARLCTFIDTLAHKWPDLRVLELGSGQLFMTDQLLKTLTTRHGAEPSPTPRFGRYDYTSIACDAVSDAKGKYSSLGARVGFSTLDVGQSPDQQGFEHGSYDLVVVSSLHGSSDLPAYLESSRKLLKPGGKLVVVEPEYESLRTNFIFRLPALWSGKGPHLQGDGDLDKELRQAGFSGRDVILRDSDDPASRQVHIAISTAKEKSTTPGNAPEKGGRLIFIHLDSHAEQECLAHQLQQSAQEDEEFDDIGILSVTSAVDALPFEDNAMLIFLLEVGAPVWYDIEESLFGQLQKLFTYNLASRKLWICQEGTSRDETEHAKPAYRLIDGLSRVLNSELDDEVLSILTLQQHGLVSRTSHILSVVKYIRDSSSEFIDTEWVEKNGWLCVPRVVQSAVLNQEMAFRLTPRSELRRAWQESTQPDGGVPLRLALGAPGLLNTLHFVEDHSHYEPLAAGDVEIRVEAVGLNYRDVLAALGRLQDANLGCECAGIVTRVGSQVKGLEKGDRVAALSGSGCYRTYLRTNHLLAARIPDSMPFHIAAAMIVNHFTAWATLHDLGRLASNETVLVHCAAGGTGQAAVQVARHVGARVLATAGTSSKKAFLAEHYGIQRDCISNSRDPDAFSHAVRRMTDGRGVDVVLNALSGESLTASWGCLAPLGRFFEIGKYDIHARGSLPMAPFDDCLSFQAFDIQVICKSKPEMIRPTLERLFSLYEQGVLSPASPLQLHGLSDLEKVYRAMQRGEVMGKVVFEMRPEEEVKVVIDRKPSTTLPPDATYLIAGGLGGLGRSMATWLVERGARNLILLSRSGACTKEARDFIEHLTRRAVRVAAPPCDISDSHAFRSILEACSDMPPIRGAIQATMVLRDGVFIGMAHETWQATTASKVQGPWNMHTLLPPDMDFFIGLSSVAGVAGGRGQANYAAGNTFIDALMKYRVSRGQHGATLDLGPFMEVGFVSKNADLKNRWEARRAMAVTESELFALLDCYCSGQKVPPQVVYGISGYVGDKSTRHYFRKPMLRTLALEDDEAEPGSGGGEKSAHDVDFATVFATAPSLAEAATAVDKALLQMLASILALPREELNSNTPLHTYGVDSLVAVEIRNWLAKEVHADLAIFHVLGGATTHGIGTLAASKTTFKKPY